MTDERWRQIEMLFAQAVECPPRERLVFLDQVCGADLELRHELESLLSCDAPDQRLVEMPDGIAASLSDDSESDPDMAGRRIGPYRLTRLIGHGGMGAVYLGVRDDDQYQKQVAIKLLKRGMDTAFMLSRFRQERQILANLEHPFIARLMDGGATDDGLPYFVMEYVDGVPITKYCARKNLSVPERLRLFRLVCEAVQHAHQNLVVHRDLKPSNILTTKEGVPKLLDFGIAKVVDPNVAGDATATRREFQMMTPDYASPEQVRGLPISTASDTYSLGTVLYELLAGVRPYRFQLGVFAEIERTVCEVEPEKPSLAAARNEELPPIVRGQLKRQLSGDLDNIVLTAMHKEPQRRYASAAEFSEDLRRHLEGLPIVARVDRWTYRTGKFIRRNRLAVGAAVLVAASLVGGIITTTIQARRAERRFELGRQLANSVLFDIHDRIQPLPGSISARLAMVQTVVAYLDSLAEDSGGDPGLDLEMAQAYVRVASLEGHPFRPNLGQTVVALGHYKKAIAIFERLAGLAETRDKATRGAVGAHQEAASVEVVLGHPSSAEFHLQRAVTLAADAPAHGVVFEPRHLAALYENLGSLASDRGDTEAELANMSKAVEQSQKWADADPSSDALLSLRNSNSQLAKAQAHAGDLYGARDSFRLALQVADQLKSRPDPGYKLTEGVVGIHHLFGDLLGATDDANLGEPAEALSHYRAAADVGEKLVARDANDVNPRRNLAGSYRRIGLVLLADRPAEALESYQKAVAISTAINALEPRNIHYRSALADGLLGLGQALFRLGRRPEALEKLGQALELQKSIEAAAPGQLWLLRSTSRTYLAIGNVLLDQGNTEQALANYREGLGYAERSFQHYASSLSMALDRGELLEAMGAYYLALAARPGASNSRRAAWRAEARSSYEKSLAIWQDWNARKVAIPYAERRLNRTQSILSSIP